MYICCIVFVCVVRYVVIIDFQSFTCTYCMRVFFDVFVSRVSTWVARCASVCVGHVKVRVQSCNVSWSGLSSQPPLVMLSHPVVYFFLEVREGTLLLQDDIGGCFDRGAYFAIPCSVPCSVAYWNAPWRKCLYCPCTCAML